MRFNWALLGLVAGIGIGVFLQSFTIETIIDGVRQHMVTIALGALAAFVILGLAGVLLERFFRKTLKPRYDVASDVVGDATAVVGRALKLDGRDVENVSQIVRSGASIYGAWSFRLLFLRTTLGLLIALGGAFATFVLIQQNDLLREQSRLLADQNEAVSAQTTAAQSQTDLLSRQLTLSEAQNELMALNLVATLRERLSRQAMHTSEVMLPQMEGSFFPVDETALACELAQTTPDMLLYQGGNPSELGAISDLMQSASLGPRVKSALNHLLRDEDPSVAFAAFQLLDRHGGAEAKWISLENIIADVLTIESDAHVSLSNSILGKVTCDSCTFSFESSLAMAVRSRGLRSVTNSVILEWQQPSELPDAATSRPAPPHTVRLEGAVIGPPRFEGQQFDELRDLLDVLPHAESETLTPPIQRISGTRIAVSLFVSSWRPLRPGDDTRAFFPLFNRFVPSLAPAERESWQCWYLDQIAAENPFLTYTVETPASSE